MSFDIVLLAAVIILSVLVLLCGCIAFTWGYRLGVKDYNTAHTEAPKAEIEPKKAAATPKEDPKLRELTVLMENIENYDGTSDHQKDLR